MTTRNSILLILKQSPGVEFNALLSKISANYGNINSARAALSRALKDMNAVGLVQRQERKIFATDKGMAALGSEMKTKLILRLNELVKGEKNVESIDSIIELVSTLIERAKQDADLLKAARGSTAISLSDLQRIGEKLEAKTRHLNYLSEVLIQQIDSLKQLNFNDSVSLPWNEGAKILNIVVEKSLGQEVLAECISQDFFEKAKQAFNRAKIQEKSIFLSKEQINELVQIAGQSISFSSTVNIYAGSIKIQLNHPNIFFIGPVQELEEIKKQEKAAVV